MRTLSLILVVFFAAGCSSTTPANQSTDAIGDAARQGEPAQSVTSEGSEPVEATTDDLPRVPVAGDPFLRPDGSAHEFEEGSLYNVDGVLYVIQAADYEGPPVLYDDGSGTVSAAPTALPEINLPLAPPVLDAGLTPDEFAALFADVHGPTDSFATQLNRVAPFPMVLDSRGDVVIVGHAVELLSDDEAERGVTVAGTYETELSLADSLDHHRQQLIDQGYEPREIEIESENGVETSRRLNTNIMTEDLQSVWVSFFARPSELAPGLSSVSVSARYTVPVDWPTFQQLQEWSGLAPLTDTAPTQFDYHSTMSPDGVLSAYMHTRWLAPEPVDEAFEIARERAGGFDDAQFDRPENRIVTNGADPEIYITAREHWEDDRTELTLYQSRPLLVWDERIRNVETAAPDQDLDQLVGEIVPLDQIQTQYVAELADAGSKDEVDELFVDVVASSRDNGAIAELNRLAPFPAVVELPPQSDIWVLALEASYVNEDTRAQRIRFSLTASVDQDEQQLYDFFTEQMVSANATNIDERVTRTPDGVVEDAELSFVVARAGVVTSYEIDVGRRRFEADVSYVSATEPDYVKLLARNVTIDLPIDGPLVAASIGNDESSLRNSVAVAYDQQAYPDGGPLFASLVPIIEEIGTVTVETPTTVRYTQPGVDVRVNYDDWGFGPGTLSYTVKQGVG